MDVVRILTRKLLGPIALKLQLLCAIHDAPRYSVSVPAMRWAGMHAAGRSRSQGGLGLGLYLCRLVVARSFGGRIWVAASDKRGTTFRFTVPARIRT